MVHSPELKDYVQVFTQNLPSDLRKEKNQWNSNLTSYSAMDAILFLSWQVPMTSLDEHLKTVV